MSWLDLQQQALDCFHQGNYDEAAILLQKCIDHDPDDRFSYWFLGLTFLLQNAELEAKSTWLSILMQATPDEVELWSQELLQLLRGAAIEFLNAGQFATAQQIATQMLDLEPTFAPAQLVLGAALLKQGEGTTAIEALQSAIALQPDLVEAYISLGAALKQQQRLDEAITVLQQALAWRPQDAAAWYNLGTCLTDQQQIDAAIEAFQQAIVFQPTLMDAYISLGTLLDKQQQTEIAIAVLQQSITINPNCPDSHYILSYCFRKQGQYRAAIEQCHQAFTLKPDFALAYLQWGEMLVDTGILDDTINQVRQDLAEQPDDLVTLCKMAICLRRQGLAEEPKLYFERILQLCPTFLDTHFWIGECLLAMGQFEAAIAQMQLYLELQPNPQLAEYLRQVLASDQAGFAPILRKGYCLWDAMVFKDQDIYRLFYLAGTRSRIPFWSAGEIHAAISTDLKTWEYLGVAIEANPNCYWQSGRMLAGTVYREADRYYYFYSASPPKPMFLEEHIGLATSTDGVHWECQPDPFIKQDNYHYGCNLSACYQDYRRADHFHWRDPFPVKEASSGRYYLFITAYCPQLKDYHACIGLAVADQIAGPYELLPPALAPTLEDSQEGVFLEMERPQIIYRYGQYHLFFSSTVQHINPKWLPEHRASLSDSSVYWYVSDSITGPFRPAKPLPVVPGSERTGLYGTNFLIEPDGRIFAHGCYSTSSTLEVGHRFPVHWDEETIAIQVDRS